MSRPPKTRRVCVMPPHFAYGPITEPSGEQLHDSIILTVVEYECIRLMDYEGLNQVESAEAMCVARSSVQRTYENARRKMAQALVEGKIISIEGGDYQLCKDDMDMVICETSCPRRRRRGRNR